MPEIIVFVVSLAAVVFGADWLGNSAVHISKKLYLPRILIGATFVSVATTLPEIIIGGVSAVENQRLLGLGTILGSPITNIGFVMGIVLLFSKEHIQQSYYLRTVQIFLAVLAIVFIILTTVGLNPLSGLLLIATGLVYLILEFVVSKHEEGMVEKIDSRIVRFKNMLQGSGGYEHIFYLLAGGLLLLTGAHFLIGSATVIAGFFGIPQLVIGVAVIAFGTSLPETITAINSIIRKRTDISAGNLFGASILDFTLALGILALFGKIQIDQSALYLTIGTSAGLAVFSLIPIFGKFSPKMMGLVSIAIYIAFLIWFAGVEI